MTIVAMKFPAPFLIFVVWNCFLLLVNGYKHLGLKFNPIKSQHISVFRRHGDLRGFDINKDGKVTFQEIAKVVIDESKELLMEDTLVARFMSSLSTMFFLKASKYSVQSFKREISKLIQPADLIIIVLGITTHRKMLRALFSLKVKLFSAFKRFGPIKDWGIFNTDYSKSLLSYVEVPLSYLVWTPPLLYLLDIGYLYSVYIGHAKISQAQSYVRLVNACITSFIVGSLVTKVKDWVCMVYRHHSTTTDSIDDEEHEFIDGVCIDYEKEKKQKAALTDELSSGLVWFIVAANCLELCSVTFGITVGSIFALGGIGSASIILALRPVFENLLGGILLRLRDEFRVGDKVEIYGDGNVGRIRNMTLMYTCIRFSDNSIVSIPNFQFSQKKFVNWSRTPYRKFSTIIQLLPTKTEKLIELTDVLRRDLREIDKVESTKRHVDVKLIALSDGCVNVQVDLHMKLMDSKTRKHDRAVAQTQIIDTIVRAVNDSDMEWAIKNT